MRILLKQAVCIENKDYALGVHEIPESVLKHKFFHQLVLSGKAVEAEAVHIVTAETLEDKQNKLLNKIMGTAHVEKVEVVEDVASVEEVVEDDQASRKSKSNKRK